jgi:hypothetical protein
MPLQHLGFIDLPPHAKDGGFDHADVHEPTGRIYVAHTANDAVDIIDIEAQRYVTSISGLPAVAGALIAEPDLVFTSNRGANTVGLFTAADAPRVDRIGVGIRPNGLAYDPRRARLLVAHVGDPAVPGSCTVSVVDPGRASGLPTSPSPAVRAGPSMIRLPTSSTSMSQIRRRSSSSRRARRSRFRNAGRFDHSPHAGVRVAMRRASSTLNTGTSSCRMSSCRLST